MRILTTLLIKNEGASNKGKNTDKRASKTSSRYHGKYSRCLTVVDIKKQSFTLQP